MYGPTREAKRTTSAMLRRSPTGLRRVPQRQSHGYARLSDTSPFSKAGLSAPNIYLSLTITGRSRRLNYYPVGRLIWIRAPKTAFGNAPTRSGPHMVACTATPISIGLQPSGKSWRHQRPRSPANRSRKRSAGRLHVRRSRERSRWPANAAHHSRDASAHPAHSTQHERY